MTKCNALTDKQKKMVEDNHDLIYSYAHKRSVSIDEYYDVLAIGLCKAAGTFDESKGRFSTLAYKCMDNELVSCWRKIQEECETEVLSYDAQNVRDDPDNQSDFLGAFADWQSCRDIELDAMIQDIEKRLTYKEVKVFRHLLNEMSQADIAEKLCCTKQTVNEYVQSIRNKVMYYMQGDVFVS